MSRLYSCFLSTYNDRKQDSFEGTECIPILICVCGPESGNWVVDRCIDESNRDTMCGASYFALNDQKLPQVACGAKLRWILSDGGGN